MARKKSAVAEISLDHEKNDFENFQDSEQMVNIIGLNKLKKFEEEELTKPRNKKLRVFFEKLKENPEVTDIKLAEDLKIHRNTVSQRRKELRILFEKTVSQKPT